LSHAALPAYATYITFAVIEQGSAHRFVIGLSSIPSHMVAHIWHISMQSMKVLIIFMARGMGMLPVSAWL
jgi:hypothetical protein